MAKRLSWKQIKERYPHQNVGLVDVEYGGNAATVKSGIVKYTDKELSFDELSWMAFNKQIVLRYTTLDEDELQGVCL